MKDCLPEPALWPAAEGECLPPEVESHLRSCARCSAQVDELIEHRRQMSAEAACRTSPIGFERSVRPLNFTGVARPRSRHELRSPYQPDFAAATRPHDIGGYPVERLLKLGGQAEVYLARHATLDRHVVIKWSYATLADDPQVADQFTEEARLLAALRHRNLPRVVDLGIAADRPFLVLEYIAGDSLATQRTLPIPPEAAARLIAQVSRALHIVHEFGRLHLDIQPDNILLGDDGVPRLIDFGMSRPLFDGPRLRCCAGLQGTPEYMAPEQLAGDINGVGIATDLYSLGAVLHELLYGCPPQPEVVWSDASSRGPTRLSSHSSQTPRRLQEICRRALDPDPRRRYVSALQFARELEGMTRGPRMMATALMAGSTLLAASLWASVSPLCPAMDECVAPARENVGHHQRTTLIATALCQSLSEPDVQHRSTSIILADGQVVAFNTPHHESTDSARDFVKRVSHDLGSQPGTTLLLFSDTSIPAHGACGSGLEQWDIPDLPAGTIAQLTESAISVVVDGSSDASARAAALQRVQSELRQRMPRFSALVLTASPQSGASGRSQTAIHRVAGASRGPDLD